MNGGVHHVECLSPYELIAAKDGYTFFGFESVGRLLDRATRLDEGDADKEYAGIIPDDSAIDHRFAEIYARSPELFAPLE